MWGDLSLSMISLIVKKNINEGLKEQINYFHRKSVILCYGWTSK